MTSRNSFFNLLKEDFRRRLWTFILSSLVFFGTFFVAFTMVLQNYVQRYSKASLGYTGAEFIDRVSNRLCNDFYGAHAWFILVAVVGAIICGMSGFAYLHSRKQMDFYHSLPVKRETLFAVRFVNGIMIYAIPYLAGLLFSFLLCIVYGVMTWDIFYSGVFCFVVHLMGYIVMYLVTILAMMLTGKLVIAFFGTCVLNLYAPAVYALGMVLRETFFVTSYSSSVDIEDALTITRWFSPASYYFALMNTVNSSKGKFWLEFLSFLLLAAVLIALNLWLYKKRASEKADNAMSFKATEPVIRVMISIPVGVLAGLMFFALQYDNGAGGALFWLIFGGVLGGFLCHGVIEALYNGDIKKCLSHKIQMVVTMLVAAVVPLLFLYDVFGYDSYLPEKQEIKSMAVVSSDLRFGGSYYDENGWISPTEYALEHMEVTDIDAMYELATLLTEAVGKDRTERFFGYSDYYYGYYYAYGAEKLNYTNFVIRYTLKDGSEVTRCYEYNYYAVLDILERIYNDEEFKTAVHPVFSLMESGFKPSYLECYSPASGITVKMENCEEIVQTYAEEVLAMSFDELKNSAAIGELVVYFTVYAENSYEDSTTFLVYPSMTRTIALLKERGYNMQSLQDTANIENITVYYSGSLNELKYWLGMEVSDDYENYEENEVYYEEMSYAYDKYGDLIIPVTEETYQDICITFTDPAEIAEIKQSLVFSNYTAEFGPYPERIGYFTADVSFAMHTGATWEDGVQYWAERYRFTGDSIPQVVVDRVLEELEAGLN